MKLDDLSSDAKMLIQNCWSEGTIKQYQVYLNHWLSYCRDKGISPITLNVSEGINFLSELYLKRNLGYSAVNTARSALSNIMENKEGYSFGSHPLVKRLLSGMFRKRPALPRYSTTFDVNIVLKYLKSLGESNDLPFKSLSYRFATLFCLLSGQRCQTICSLDVRHIVFSNERVMIFVNSCVKTTRPGNHVSPLDLKAFPTCTALCPVQNLKQYLLRSFELRGLYTKLFISFSFPHRPITTSTLSRWVRETLKIAGIDTNIFTSHSTRAASTSRAKSLGLSLQQICKAAGWTNSGTFGRYYDKPVEETNFSEIILDNCLD